MAAALKRVAAVRAATVVAGAGLTGCLTPPAILPAFDRVEPEAVERYADDAERVELVAENGDRLRGLFLPAGEGAPVVLHLLEGGGSVFARTYAYDRLTGPLADLGFASLLFDYRGVGLSDGERGASRLAEDVTLMWDEAVRRAGTPDRVVLRGVSMGTVAAALLLDRGVEPAAVELVLPVRAETVVGRFAGVFYSAPVAAFAKLAYRDVTDADLYAVCEALDGPLYVVTAVDEVLMSDAELARLEGVVDAHEDGTFVRRRGDHFLVGLEARLLLQEELTFYARDLAPLADLARRAEGRAAHVLAGLDDETRARFPPGSPERAALEAAAAYAHGADPRHVAAASLVAAEPLAAARLRWTLEQHPLREDSFEALQAFYDLRDPAGPLPVDLIERCSSFLAMPQRFGGAIVHLTPEQTVFVAGQGARDYRWELDLQAGGLRLEVDADHEPLGRALVERGVPEDALARQLARVLFKGTRYPERVRADASGRVVLEILDAGTWREPEPDPTPPSQVTFSLPSLFSTPTE